MAKALLGVQVAIFVGAVSNNTQQRMLIGDNLTFVPKNDKSFEIDFDDGNSAQSDFVNKLKQKM